jgi:nucleoside phosphorylase
MNNLLVFATEMEKNAVFPNGIPQDYDCVVTGIGILSTTLNLSKVFKNKKYACAIQAGIAGAYRSKGLELEEVVEVRSDCLIEFLPWEPNTFFSSGILPFEKKLKCVKGATVLHCSDSKDMGDMRGRIAEAESMEGAAFFAVCKEYGVKSTQIRAISNYATGQPKSEWKTEEALRKLSAAFLVLFP